MSIHDSSFSPVVSIRGAIIRCNDIFRTTDHLHRPGGLVGARKSQPTGTGITILTFETDRDLGSYVNVTMAGIVDTAFRDVGRVTVLHHRDAGHPVCSTVKPQEVPVEIADQLAFVASECPVYRAGYTVNWSQHSVVYGGKSAGLTLVGVCDIHDPGESVQMYAAPVAAIREDAMGDLAC